MDAWASSIAVLNLIVQVKPALVLTSPLLSVVSLAIALPIILRRLLFLFRLDDDFR